MSTPVLSSPVGSCDTGLPLSDPYQPANRLLTFGSLWISPTRLSCSPRAGLGLPISPGACPLTRCCAVSGLWPCPARLGGRFHYPGPWLGGPGARAAGPRGQGPPPINSEHPAAKQGHWHLCNNLGRAGQCGSDVWHSHSTRRARRGWGVNNSKNSSSEGDREAEGIWESCRFLCPPRHFWY